jgi:hypothetical protein
MTYVKTKRHGTRRALEAGGSDENSANLPIVIAQWRRGANNTVMIRLDQFKGSTVVCIRAWWTSPNAELRPGRSGITMSVQHLSALARALTKAEAVARRLGLLAGTDDA